MDITISHVRREGERREERGKPGAASQRAKVQKGVGDQNGWLIQGSASRERQLNPGAEVWGRREASGGGDQTL